MLLLASDALLLLFITLGVGYFSLSLLSRMFNRQIQTGILGVFLTGLMSSSVYFNCISFFTGVNYYWLLPLFATSFWWMCADKWHKGFYRGAQKFLKLSFSKKHIFFALPLLATCFVYSIIPPMNWDSGDYHYLSILWYEKYKVVPGLANIHGRLAFNPASFIIGSAYSFTGLLGQSIYPLNVVVVTLFLLWMLRHILQSRNLFHSLVYMILVIFYFRPLLANISSPSSEPLMIVCIAYATVSLFHLLERKALDASTAIIPLLIILFSVLAKLSAIPALLMLPTVFFLLQRSERTFSWVLRIGIIAMVLFLPWLSRNVILSGYLLYPVPAVDIFSFDWKAPMDVIRLDYFSFSQWFPLLSFGKPSFDLLLFLVAMISPFYWLISLFTGGRINQHNLWLWLSVYAASWLWFMNSPEYRFGLVFLSLGFALPLLSSLKSFPSKQAISYVVLFMLTISCVYYSTQAFLKSTYPVRIQNAWLFPLRDKRYFENNDPATFRFTTLRNGVKLYMADDTHECINTDMPCMSWHYGKVEMRGNKIEDGFRNVKNEVRKHYPWLNEYYRLEKRKY